MLPAGLYRALLWCYPAPFRREYGAEMAYAFLEQIREAQRSGGRLAEASIWLDALADLALTAPREHCHVIRQDVRYALRTLAARPGFAAVAILSLALGIGANTAIFSLLNSLLLSSLPVREPQTLVMLTDPGSSGVSIGTQTDERSLLSHEEFLQLRAQAGVFQALMASQSSLERLQARVGGAEPEELRTRMVSAEYFRTLGVAPVIGRVFEPGEAALPHAVISHDYWQRRFGGRRDILGTTLALRQGSFSIVGVAPPRFFGETVGERPDVWLPLEFQPLILPGRDWLHDKRGDPSKVMWLHVFGRLLPGVGMDQAQAAANVVFQQGLAGHLGSQLAPELRKGFLNQRLRIRHAATGASTLRSQFSEPLAVLLAAAVLVLLIACANIGNLLLARATSRTREISVRLALGAGRGRLTRQLMTESTVLAFLGGVVGLAAAGLLRGALLRLAAGEVHVPLAPDARLTGFAFLITLAAGLILGLLPALRMYHIDPGAGLKEHGRGLTASARWLRAGKLIVVVQLALSLPLLIGAGLLLRTLSNLQEVDLGYAKERLLMVRVDTQAAGYEDHRSLPLFSRLLERVRAVPGVSGATYSKTGLFLGSDSGDEIEVEGYTPKGDNDRGSRYDHVGPNFFSTLGIPLLLGREITERDQPSSPKVCVINESFAKRFFDGRNPLGRRITQVYGNQRNTFEIVGVARNTRKANLRGEVEHRFFVPASQPIDVPRFISFAVRTSGDPSAVTAGVRRAILAEDPNLPITAARPLGDLVDERMTQDRTLARLSIAFGAVGLLLTAIGAYGVLSYGVARRTQEIGIRKALGAPHGAVMAMILREAGLLVAFGLAAGAALSLAGLRLVSSRLYGLAPADPVSFGLAAAALAAAALLAAWLPAYRASRVDPLIALRHE